MGSEDVVQISAFKVIHPGIGEDRIGYLEYDPRMSKVEPLSTTIARMDNQTVCVLSAHRRKSIEWTPDLVRAPFIIRKPSGFVFIDVYEGMPSFFLPVFQFKPFPPDGVDVFSPRSWIYTGATRLLYAKVVGPGPDLIPYFKNPVTGWIELRTSASLLSSDPAIITSERASTRAED